ncbi:MAG: PilZ domain-containing protein [Candidatus Aminicenantes bacterium]|nr:PilZ domain-containing protein [Candidatus Aminicenantes bacterium]
MTKKTTSKKTTKKKTPMKKVSPPDHPKINRRKEWRLELPLPGVAEGKLPKGKKFKEVMTVNNISSGGAYFCLDSGVIIGSKINLVLALPDKLSEQKKLKLCVGGITVRLEEADKMRKKHGVAIRFSESYSIIPEKKENFKK